MFSMRAPFSALGGAVLSGSLFLMLWQLIGVPMVALDHATVITPELRTVRPDTPVAPKPREKPTRKPPEPGVIRPAGPGGVTNPVTLTRPEPTTIVRPGKAQLSLGVDRDSTPIIRSEPDYPPRARQNGTEGWVQVRFTVTEIGTIRDAVVVASEPGETFDKAALDAIARWRYNPRVESGEAVERVGLQTMFRFEMEK